MTPNIKAAIASIVDDVWTTIEYTDAIRDEDTRELISSAEVAEIGFTAFAAARVRSKWPPGTATSTGSTVPATASQLNSALHTIANSRIGTTTAPAITSPAAPPTVSASVASVGASSAHRPRAPSPTRSDRC